MVPRKDSHFVLSTKKGGEELEGQILGVLASGTGIILPKRYRQTKGHSVKSIKTIDYWLEILKFGDPQQQSPLKW